MNIIICEWIRMAKGKKKKAKPTSADKQGEGTATKTAREIFKMGMIFENTIEFIESKLLDAFFGHICRQGDWDLANQYLLNVQEWVQMLQTTAKLEYEFLPDNLQEKIIKTSENLESGIKVLLKAISKKDFDASNTVLEIILKEIRALYRLRE